MYLMVAGGIITTLNILTLFVGCTPCDEDDKIVRFFLVPVVSLAMFAVTIWGSVVVFGKLNEYLTPKSLHRSRARSHFYGTEYEIWADFGPVGNTEKKSLGR